MYTSACQVGWPASRRHRMELATQNSYYVGTLEAQRGSEACQLIGLARVGEKLRKTASMHNTCSSAEPFATLRHSHPTCSLGWCLECTAVGYCGRPRVPGGCYFLASYHCLKRFAAIEAQLKSVFCRAWVSARCWSQKSSSRWSNEASATSRPLPRNQVRRDPS